ncbi:MAG: glycerol kinase [Verrucomicrobia bacterium]|nr:glycerol kinase [Verrucomicrobiota bacterium]NBU08051.1 glycerol kinase [Pseudomonadota bacterium]NDA67408.1 glycerol kinase [Verrucomicrobiota bacterium]NDB77525.1 glycerol kinase [Verrucomicrobiota bacterium]NDD39250.1 glycerol kinase [Verrucomicrobiota bacterium]
MNESQHLSTTALAKALNCDAKDLTRRFRDLGWTTWNEKDQVLELTDAGTKHGGIYINSQRFGRYIAWPQEFKTASALVSLGSTPASTPAPEPAVKPPVPASAAQVQFLTATDLGERFGLPSTRINSILSELGWIKRGIKGWVTTDQGLAIGAKQLENYKTGVPYVTWPAGIALNPRLVDTINESKGAAAPPSESKPATPTEAVGFREKFEARHRTTDGHYVRSKAEMLIDNWLYMAELVHAYERKLPVEEDLYCDFYIPTGKVYIEYWGMENDPHYRERKTRKIDIYKKYGFKLIELNDADVANLDDVLPRKLLHFGVQSY